MATDINFNKKLGISGGTNIILPSGPAPVPPFADTKSFQFDGITDRFIGVGNYSELDGQNKATFSFWIKPTYDTAKYGILFHVPRNTQTSRSQFLCFLDNSNRIRWSMNTTSYYVYSNQNVINLNQWNHVLICIDLPSTDEGKIFINGIDQTNIDNLGGRTQFDTSSGGLMIAEETQGYINPFDGNMDEVAIWSGSDQRANVSEIYNGGLPNDLNNLPTAPQPTTWQRMGEDVLWNGFAFTMTDVNGGYVNRGIGLNASDPNPTTDVPLFDNKSFTYDGVSDYVDLGTNSNLVFLGARSMSVWLKFTDNGGTRFVANFNSDAQGMYTNSGKVYFFNRDASFTWKTIATINTYNDNQWHNFIGINDGTNLKMYANGVLVNSNTDGSIGNTNSYVQRIGARWNGLTAYSGLMNDLSYFDNDQSANALTIFNGGVPNDISALSPLGYWRAEQVTFDGTNWTLIDQGSGGNNGTSSSMPLTARTSDVPLFDNKSFTYDGIADFVTIPTITLATDFSVSMWVKASTSGSVRDQVFGGASGFFLFGTVVLDGGANANKMTYYNGSSYVALTPAIRDSQWHNIVITYNSSATNLIAYTDGVETYNATYNAGTSNVIDRISEDTYGNYWKGNLNDLSVFNTELSQSDVTTIFNGGIVNDISSLNPLSYWRSEFATWDGSNWTMIDQGSGANNGTSVSMPLTSRTSDVPT